MDKQTDLEPKVDRNRILTLCPDDLKYYPVKIDDHASFGISPNKRETGFPISEIILLPPQHNETTKGETPARAFNEALEGTLLMATFFDNRPDIFYVISPLVYHSSNPNVKDNFLEWAYQEALHIPTR